MSKQAVTIIGLGPMGKAMVNRFLDEGHPVTVWNRTARKADDLVARGAHRAATVEEALAANEVVVLSLTDFEAMYAILKPAETALAGRVIVNLGSDTPGRAREAAKWATAHGAGYLTGGVMSAPSGIGAPESFTYYSGQKEIFEAHKETLEVLTGTDYRGSDPGSAALYYQLHINMFWTTVISFVHSLAMARANGISAQEFVGPASNSMTDMSAFLEFYAKRIDNDEHPGDVDRLAMAEASVDHVVHTAKEAGVDHALPAAVLELIRRGMAAGHADDSFTSLFEVFRKAG
ncbi:6-phosphogluconate dehydrogenase [Sinosporangium siamense]|uniref:6-phosphogluconate dehydrogenase n=1 Tax=Sinosporangium siamense TaxID=1367973 RepID=A0A919V690_9ACTN|nr:6-phosphogluconate dehydrogenase [Sinosporangium siamense]